MSTAVAADPIYSLKGPTATVGPPTSYNYSALTAIERCPRKWQLVHARYEDREGFPARPSPAAVEGEIVHKAMECLFRTLELQGLPAIGAPEFRVGVAAADVRGLVGRLARDNQAQLHMHPRGAGAKLTASEEQLVNRVIRLFRETYVTVPSVRPPFSTHIPIVSAPKQTPSGPSLSRLVAERGALSEFHLAHPYLPFRGVIELVWSEPSGVVITDFKTGQPRPEHQIQVGYYAVLWWRCSGVAPVRAEVRYPGHVTDEALTPARLIQLEVGLEARLRSARVALDVVQALPILSDDCRWCDVRQFCDAYWENLARNEIKLVGSVDVELRVGDASAETSVAAEPPSGGSFSVIFNADIGRALGPFTPGESLRVLNALRGEKGRTLELKHWCEIFHLP